MEEEYHKFQQGKFGLVCSDDKAKKELQNYKNSIRRLSTNEPDSYWRQIYYLRHKRSLADIENAVPKVTEVQVPTSYAISWDNNRFNRAQYLQTKIDRDNANLLIYMHKLNQRKPELENENMKYFVNSNWRKRLINTFRIGMENCTIYKRLKNIKPTVPSREQHARWYEEAFRYKLMHSRFPPYWNTRVCAPFEEVAWKRAKEIPKPIVYLDIEILGKGIGRVGFELRADLVPMTAENFRSLCTGDRGKSYRCTEITLIKDGLFWQGGSGITSIYGETFPNENYKVKHNSPGILSMVSFGEKTINSEFRISAMALPPMDNKQVALGKVILGMSFLKKMAKIAGLTESCKPKTKIIITGCGETTEEELMDIPPPDSIEAKRIQAELMTLGIEVKRKEEKGDKKTDTDDKKKRKEEEERKKKEAAHKKWEEKFGMVEYEPIPVRRSYTDINVRAEDQGQPRVMRPKSSGGTETQGQDKKKTKGSSQIKVQEKENSKKSNKLKDQGSLVRVKESRSKSGGKKGEDKDQAKERPKRSGSRSGTSKR